MKTELLGQEKNIVKIKVEFEPEEFQDGLKKALSELSQQAHIPGFRRGHTPRKILEMRLGRGTIYREALEKILPENIKKIVDDYELDPIDSPSLEIGDIHEGEPVTCTLDFEAFPEGALDDEPRGTPRRERRPCGPLTGGPRRRRGGGAIQAPEYKD